MNVQCRGVGLLGDDPDSMAGGTALYSVLGLVNVLSNALFSA